MFSNQDLMMETRKLRKFSYKLTQNIHDAEDLLHSTIVRAIEKKHQFHEGTNLFSWTSRIMYNMFVSNYRRKVKFETQYDPDSYLEYESIAAPQDSNMEVQDIGKAIDMLSDDHREILVMVCVDDMGYAEVAENLDIPVGTVRSRLSRARQNLLDILEMPNISAISSFKASTQQNIQFAA